MQNKKGDAYLNKGDIISIMSKEGQEINVGKECRLVVEENGPATGQGQIFKFVKVIK